MTVGICSIIKDCDENYLMEFVEWHKLIGVDYFFIYDNGSSIPISKTLQNFENVFVNVIIGEKMLFTVYNTFIKTQNLFPKCDWVAFIDDDEFIVPENGDIKATLEEYSEYSGLAINWRQFGSSGLEFKTPEPQKEKFIMATPSNFGTNRHVKTIAKPEKLFILLNPHIFSYKDGYCVNVNKEIVTQPFSGPIHEKIWINHYFCRSKEEYLIKQKRRNVDDGGVKSIGLFYHDDKNSTIEDRKIIEIYNRLKNNDQKDFKSN